MTDPTFAGKPLADLPAVFSLHCFLVGHGIKLAKNTNFGPNLAVFGTKVTLLGREKKFWYPHIGKPMRHHLFRVENIDRRGSNWPLGTKMCSDSKIWTFGATK